jgi:hypothetical protein
MDLIGVVDVMAADKVTEDIQCYCHRYYWTEALPSVPMLVMLTPIQMLLWMFAEQACQTVGLV